ncbi:acetyl-CoA carboxylase biotin carboxylase subunit [Leifsonia sp. McL0607]|uniref:acetyl-CoA carboxylase biotin carboxylase subunit n=1 Tax=Leifsonia sp. McL0607 TaxID=3415672 RepID=UPI003CF80402
MRKLLIANRGEIAVRVIRSAHKLGIATVAVVSEADRESLAARLADEAVVIGPAPVASSYLDAEAVLRAADETNADAVHPGYGFLSENAEFARSVIRSGRIWVGPSPETIELMGDKARAIAAARAAGVSVVPGTDGPLTDTDEACVEAAKIGFPLLIKASAGGGGRGIRLVENGDELAATLATARAEARASFGDDTVYLEAYLRRARHIEVQILGDGARCIHLGDRDCSMQRRSQKVLEEAPAPNLPEEVRREVRAAAIRLAEATRYIGAGTVEFLYDPDRSAAYFIEMNTRLQVEHPVTEQITGIDLVEQQLRVAQGEPLAFRQEDIQFSGHAIECRINAEDPDRQFFPSPGLITVMRWPDEPGSRVDAGYDEGLAVPPFYDSLVAKVIVHATTRAQAIETMERTLADSRIEGIATTIPLHRRLLDAPEFIDSEHTTTFVEAYLSRTAR